MTFSVWQLGSFCKKPERPMCLGSILVDLLRIFSDGRITRRGGRSAPPDPFGLLNTLTWRGLTAKNIKTTSMIRLGMHTKDETHSSKIHRVMAIFYIKVNQNLNFRKFQNLRIALLKLRTTSKMKILEMRMN